MWTVFEILAYIYMGAILNRSNDTRQRDYRQADTDVGADVNETAGHFGPPDPLNRSHPLQPRKAAPVSLAAP